MEPWLINRRGRRYVSWDTEQHCGRHWAKGCRHILSFHSFCYPSVLTSMMRFYCIKVHDIGFFLYNAHQNIKRSITKSNLNFDKIIIPWTFFCLFAAYYMKIVNYDLNCRWSLTGFQFSRPLWCVLCLQIYWGLDVFTVGSIWHSTNKESPRLKFIGSSDSQTSLLLFQLRPLHARCIKRNAECSKVKHSDQNLSHLTWHKF